MKKTLTVSALFALIIGTVAAFPLLAQEAQNRKIPETITEAEKMAEEMKPESKEDIYRQLDLFGQAFERVRQDYVDETLSEELIEAAINGMLTHLDPHSSYLNEDGLKDISVQTRGEFGGLGIEVTMESGFIKVVSPIDDTPAFEAGIEAGDFITHLDGKPVLGLNLSEAVDMMRGKVNTTIELTIRREGETEALKIPVTRDIITIQSVRHKILGDVGYIRISSFNGNTDEGVKDAVKEVESELGDTLRGYILDMRNNPGGLLNQAIAVSDMFLEQGEIVSTRGRHDSDTKRDVATPGDITKGLPIVVLVNAGSASASEIVSGALQDHRRAVIIGEQTFGKGSVQTIMQVPSHGALRLTTARYYTPSGRSIQAKGITPDIIIEAAKIEKLNEDTDLLVKESDLRGALEAEKNAQEEANTDIDKAGKSDVLSEGDYQLARALDLVRGISFFNEELSSKAKAVNDNNSDHSAESAE